MKFLFLIPILAGLAYSTGCVCQPGGKIVNYWGWRSVQCESATNVDFQVDGGGTVKVPVSAIPK